MTILLQNRNRGHAFPLLLFVLHLTLKSFISRKPLQHLGSQNAEPRLSVPRDSGHCLLCEGQHLFRGPGLSLRGCRKPGQGRIVLKQWLSSRTGKRPAPSQGGLGAGGCRDKAPLQG